MSVLASPAATRSRRTRRPWASMAMVLPAAAVMLIFFLVPMVLAVYIAFTNQSLEGAHATHYGFVGLDNFRRMWNDAFFRNSIWITVIFVVLSAVVGQSLLGLVLSLLQERAFPWLRLSISTIVITAWVMPEISAAVLWYAFAQPGGTLDSILGPGQAETSWINNAPLAIVCVANLWRGTAFSMLIFGAALRNVPGEIKESAVLDGASAWQQLALVVIPIIRSTIVTNLILVTITNLSDFTLIYGITQGGPNNATMTLPLYMYVQSFNFSDLAYGTAIALVLIVIGAIASIAYVRLLRTEI